jgi:membrane fusion protein (multidrug efflux system)
VDSPVKNPSQARERTQERDDESRDGDPRPQDSREPRNESWLRRPVVLITGGVILVVVLAGIFLWWWHSRQFESTDDAFIDARVVRLSPRVSGQVIAVHADDNQLVHAGDVLVEIDPADIRAALDQAQAQESQAETALGQAQADVALAQAQYQQSLAAIAGAEAQAVNAAKDLQRYQELKASTPQAVAQGQLDQATAAARSAAAQRDAARQQSHSAQAQIASAHAAVAGAQARVETARAQVRQAQLNLEYTRVVAPVTGHVARRTVAVGTYVSPGQQMLAIVPLQVWVTANFKETQLDLMRPGQSVTLSVDACPGADIRGHVDSIQRGAGQAFALLPPENATGNYVKVVQRVPVKIVLDQVPRNCPLGPGMSVEPAVRVR